MEKHLVNGGSLPMVTASSLEDVGKATKFGGPALTIATTVFDMAMAESRHDACVALVSGAAGAGGGWAGAELGLAGGAALGLTAGPGALVAVPVLALGGALFGGFYAGELGKLVGNVKCPH